MGRCGAALVALLLCVDLVASFDRPVPRLVSHGRSAMTRRARASVRAVDMSVADVQAGVSDAVAALTQVWTSARLPVPATVDWASKGESLLNAAAQALPPTVPVVIAEVFRWLQASGLAALVGYVLGGAGIVAVVAVVAKLMSKDPMGDDSNNSVSAPPPGQPYGPANTYDAALAAAYFARRPTQVTPIVPQPSCALRCYAAAGGLPLPPPRFGIPPPTLTSLLSSRPSTYRSGGRPRPI